MKLCRKYLFFFQMDAILECVFQKRKQLHFSGGKKSKLHQKDTILLVTITFFLKQGQICASSGPITVPLNLHSRHSRAAKYIPCAQNVKTVRLCTEFDKSISNIFTDMPHIVTFLRWPPLALRVLHGSKLATCPGPNFSENSVKLLLLFCCCFLFFSLVLFCFALFCFCLFVCLFCFCHKDSKNV